jgi:uncharacterized protein YjbJ (UPF0337 family)
MPSRNSDEIRGRIDQAAGEIKSRVGRATGDTALESEGLNQRDVGDIPRCPPLARSSPA